MKKLLLAVALFIGLQSSGQKIYVNCDDPKPKGSIEKKITELKYLVVSDSANADIVAKFNYVMQKSAISFKIKADLKGYISFLDKNGILLSKTNEVGGLRAGWSGYNPRVDAAWKILTRDFEQKLKEAVSKVSGIKPEPKKESAKSETLSVADELTKLKKLYDEGVLTKEEFEAQKKKLLNQ